MLQHITHMKVIKPNCRVQFEAQDIDFVLSVLGTGLASSECLVQLLADEDSRDQVLDNPELVKALQDRGGCLRVSTRCFFYILVRHGLRQSGIEDRNVADYVAEVLTQFASTERSRYVLAGGNPLEYLYEMLAALQGADDRNKFVLRAHMGNYSLFLSGVFPERIRARAELKGCPDLRYYEGVGRSQFRMAGDHWLAERYELTQVFQTLADRFETTRLALNEIADRALFLNDSASSSIEGLLQRFRN